MEIFNKDYIQSILKPFEGKRLRMRTENEDGSFSIPFCLETSIEDTFQFEFTNMGIKFLLKDNYYIKKDLKETLKNAVHELGIHTSTLDKLLKEDSKEDLVIFSKIVKHFEENFKPQIAFTYYNMIKSLKVSNNGFIMNRIKFLIYN